jgi:hypothetical protein
VRKSVPALVAIVLLAGSATAFAITERLKLEPSPITDTKVDKLFSPVCACPTATATIAFRLRRPERITVTILDSGNRVVRTLARDESFPAGPVSVAWDGRDEAGAVVPEGSYRPRVVFERHGRTIVLPNPIRVDTTRPRVLDVSLRPASLSPDGDGVGDKISVGYRLSERAHTRLLVEGVSRVRTRSQRPTGKLDWYGKIAGGSVPAGEYELAIVAEDVAGNVSAPTSFTVQVQYVDLARDVIRTKALTRFGVLVRTDAETFRWRFARGSGTARAGLLVLRAPRRPGRYTLYVSANGHGDRARVVVRARR